jgi:hypothetical protein
MTAWAENKKQLYNNALINLLDGFVHSGHLIAFGLASVVFLSTELMGIKLSLEFFVVIYLLTLGPCLFGRYIDLKKMR